MDKKILSIVFLLTIVIAVTATYVTYNTLPASEEGADSSSSEDVVTNDDISDELDDMFIPEDEDVELGDMV